MTAAMPGGSGSNLFSVLSNQNDGLHRRRETFLLSLLGQAAVLALLIYLTGSVIREDGPRVRDEISNLDRLPLIFTGNNGGGGGNHDPVPASHGNPPPASLDPQLVPPTIVLTKEPPKLPAPETVTVAPDVKLPIGGQIGDPTSKFSALSQGPSGPSGFGEGCCNGIGPSKGSGMGDGPEGIFPRGTKGMTEPVPVYSPEPNFSDEARKLKAQGMVLLLLVVGKDGHPYNIRVSQSLGMGLDEKAIEAVNHWRFRPATLNGQPVATPIAVQVDFRLY